jgi:hypothetical protein
LASILVVRKLALSEIATSIPATGHGKPHGASLLALINCKYRSYINIGLESHLPIFGRHLIRELSATSSAGLT